MMIGRSSRYNIGLDDLARLPERPTMVIPLHLDTAEYEFLVSPLTSRVERPTEPSTGSVKVQLGGDSHPGKVRERNEDHYMVAHVRRTLNVLSHNLPKDEMPEHL